MSRFDYISAVLVFFVSGSAFGFEWEDPSTGDRFRYVGEVAGEDVLRSCSGLGDGWSVINLDPDEGTDDTNAVVRFLRLSDVAEHLPDVEFGPSDIGKAFFASNPSDEETLTELWRDFCALSAIAPRPENCGSPDYNPRLPGFRGFQTIMYKMRQDAGWTGWRTEAVPKGAEAPLICYFRAL